MAENDTLKSAKAKEAHSAGWWGNVPGKTKLIIIVIIGFYLYSRSLKGLTAKDFLFALGFGFLVLYLLGKETVAGKGMLLEPEAWQFARDWMQDKVDSGQFLSGTDFRMEPLSALSYNPGNIPPNYSFGCDVVYPSGRIARHQIVMSAFPPANPTLQEGLGKFDGRKETVIVRNILDDYIERMRKRFPEFLKRI